MLAVTATANDAVADDIDAVLPIQDSVIDETARDNLYLDDQRNIPHRDDYLASLVATGEDRHLCELPRAFRGARAHAAPAGAAARAMIGFYNAGLSATSANASRSCSVATT